MATTTVQKRVWTYADVLELPEDGKRYEIMAGELYVAAAPSEPHQAAEIYLSYAFYGHVSEFGLGRVYSGPFDIKFSEHDVVQPDLVFISRDHLEIIGDKDVSGAPDLVIEIISPTTRRRDEEHKRALYEQYGVREYWLVNPINRTVTIFELVNGQYEVLVAPGQPVRSKVLPNLVIDLEALFGNR